ncbi:YybH family protein [Methanosarcina sp.]|uniref:YybH family protein n=1 Tax=Methanosarcina sp. TaxID=2213 RepID=UPI003C71B694
MTTEDVRNIIEDLSRQFEAAIQTQDIVKIVQLYTEKPKFMPRGGDIPQFGPIPDDRWSREYISRYWYDVFQVPESGFKYVQRVYEIEVLGNVAYEIGTYSLAADTGVGDDLEKGVYFIFWKKEGDQWKIAVHILNTASSPKWLFVPELLKNIQI